MFKARVQAPTTIRGQTWVPAGPYTTGSQTGSTTASIVGVDAPYDPLLQNELWGGAVGSGPMVVTLPGAPVRLVVSHPIASLCMDMPPMQNYPFGSRPMAVTRPGAFG